VQPDQGVDKFRKREIEQRLAAELQAASERLRRAFTEEDKRKATEANVRALKRFTDFVARGLVPEDLIPPEQHSARD
jgi:hypothetical protein